jgi:hypothetical protein
MAQEANPPSSASESSPYEIQIQGQLDDRWAEWFNGIQMTIEHPNDRLPFTRLNCPAIDQAKLRGILNKIWDMNLNLISVRQVKEDAYPYNQQGLQDCSDDTQS